VEVKTFGEVHREHKEAVNIGIFELLNNVLSIPSENIYVTYHEQKVWGCNGGLL